MGMTDNLKARATVGMERATNAWGALRGTPAQAAATPSVDYSQYDKPTYQRQQTQFGQGKPFEYDPNKFHMERGTGALRPNAAIDPTRPMTPPQNMASSVVQPQRAGMSKLGAGLAGVGSALYGLDAMDSAVKGDAGNAVGSAGMAAAPFAGPAGLATMAADAGSRALTDKSLTDWIGTGIAKAFGPGERSMMTPEFQKVVAAAGGPGQYAASLRSRTPVAAPVVAAPVAAGATSPSVETFAPGTEGARGIRAQIAGRDIPVSGGGWITNNSTGSAVRINPPPAEPAAAPISDRDALVATLRSEMAGARNGRARRDAAGRLAGVLDNEAQRDISRRTAERETTKFNAELGDKRMKEFNEQFVNNQFYSGDKDGKSVADVEKNARFLDFARQTDPRWGTAEGAASIMQLPAQERNKLVAEMRRSFLEKENVEQVTNDRALLSRPGYSNQPVTLRGTPREAVAGDIPDIGIRNYLWSNLPLTNRDVVDTDRGAIMAEEYIGTGEDNRSRRSKLYPEKVK